jgi:hypothetical protein
MNVTSVIPDTQELEIGGTMVQGHPSEKLREPISTKRNQGMVQELKNNYELKKNNEAQKCTKSEKKGSERKYEGSWEAEWDSWYSSFQW